MIAIAKKYSENGIDHGSIRGQKSRLFDTMIHKSSLDSIHLANFRSNRVDPINQGIFGLVLKKRLMFCTQTTKKENMPIVVMFFPPLKVDMIGCIDGRFNNAKGFCFGHKNLLSIISDAKIQITKMR